MSASPSSRPGPIRARVPSASPYASVIGFSAAATAAGWTFTAGVSAADDRGSVVGRDAYSQAREVLRKLIGVLESGGMSASDVVQTRTYLTRAADWPDVGRAHGEVFAQTRPASTMVVVAALLDPAMLVEMEAVAYRAPGENEADN
jgi:enamine deaminase RidA (YjgF/YER057c/UK114 family)